MNKEEISNLNQIRFSVSMCVYKNDDAEHFHTAIESIINQIVKPDEIVLVVDGPIPKSIDDVIRIYENEDYFKVIRLPQNVGHGNARRISLKNCRYELVALMDADDISLPDRFEKQVKCFKADSALSIVGSNIKEFIDTTENIVGIRKVPENDFEIKKYLKMRCPFNQVTVMFKKTEVEKAGGYQDWYQNEDYYLWIRMFMCGSKFMNLNESLVLVRVGREMYKRRGGFMYFRSEAKLQRYMLTNRVISVPLYIYNTMVRIAVQVLIPNWLRVYLYNNFARKRV